MGRARQPDSTKTESQACKTLAPVPKNFAFVESPIAVGIFEDQNSIAFAQVVIAAFIGEALDHPQTTTIIDFESDRLVHLWITSEKGGIESLW